MKPEEARKATKYFTAGVSAEIWCYSGDGQWCININREGRKLWFSGLDDIKRSLLHLVVQVERKDKEMEFRNLGQAYESDGFVPIYTIEDAVDLINETEKAINFIQTKTTASEWHEVPANLLNRVIATLAECSPLTAAFMSQRR